MGGYAAATASIDMSTSHHRRGKPEEEEDEEEADITDGGKGQALLWDLSRSISGSAAAPVVLMNSPSLDHFSLLTERSRCDTEPITAL